ncbi:RNase H domain-containing protein [Trichonephila clavipes]|nr:RNase H domain-containing protein [Trichonephila clavipes]
MPPNTLQVHTEYMLVKSEGPQSCGLSHECRDWRIFTSPSVSMQKLRRLTTGEPLAPCYDEFRGPRSDYVRQVALETTAKNTSQMSLFGPGPTGEGFITAYTEGSSNSECGRGGSGIFLLLPHQISCHSRKNRPFFTSELIAIKAALALYLTQSVPTNGLIIFFDCKFSLEAIKRGKMRLVQDINELLSTIVAKEKTCTIQWVPAHLNIEGNEHADSLAKEARNIDPPPIKTTCLDVNAVAKHRLCDGSWKKWCLPELNLDRVVTTTISRMRMGHTRGMKIMPKGSRTYTECRHYPRVQLDPGHLFNCISVASTLFNIDPNCCHDTLYTEKVGDMARTVLHAFGPI